MNRKPVHICFVCLGNICRSPTAEGVMRRLVSDLALGDQFEIDSAGTAAYHVGERADKRARQAASRRQTPLESRARQFQSEDFESRDFVLAMDQSNLADLSSLQDAEAFQGHLSLLRDFDPIAHSGSEVPDPYYGGDTGFEDVLDQCEAACRGLIEHLRNNGRIE
jgi:protein-tyrosine phosphatase